MSHVLVSPLNWGLGHATRDIPIIKTLLSHGHDVTIAACGSALAVLRKEFPECSSIDYPDYPVPYSSGHFFIPKFCASFPSLLQAIAEERSVLDRILAKDKYDLIISDNRLGVFSSEVPSVFVTHQLHYHLPFPLWPVELLAIPANAVLHEKFRHIVVPDNPPGPTSLAGKLSRPETDIARERVFFSGILSGAKTMACQQDLDYLFVISGPEPQRTFLETILTEKLEDFSGKGVVLLGSPQKPFTTKKAGRCTCISYASTEEKMQLMNRARCICCRSGYTTMMELAELGKQRALLIPTPGQTEQEYLSWYYEKQGWYYSTTQEKLDLSEDLAATRDYKGFPDMPKTEQNTPALYDELLAQYLE
ncbi:MAG: hypothetical protein WC342_09645 [Methanoregula sp.]|jgi:hypothetical protein